MDDAEKEQLKKILILIYEEARRPSGHCSPTSDRWLADLFQDFFGVSITDTRPIEIEQHEKEMAGTASN